MVQFLRELLLAWRTVWKSPAFAAVAVVSLGLAIALNTTLFGVIDAYFRPMLPIHEPDRLLLITFTTPRNASIASVDRYRALRENTTSFAAVAAIGAPPVSPGVTVQSSHGDAHGVAVGVTGSFFQALGEQPFRGRLFSGTAEDLAQRAVVISHKLWVQLGEDEGPFTPFVVRLNGQTFTVVGVLPPNGEYPQDRDVFVLIGNDQASGPYLVRLQSGTTRRQADAELRVISAQLTMNGRGNPAARSVRYHTEPAISVPTALDAMHLLLVLAAAIVLILACGNVANLQLGRGIARSHDLTIRSALGASRGDIVRHLFLESLVLAMAGGVVGVLMSVSGIFLLRMVVPPGVGWLGLVRPHINWHVMIFGVGISGLTAILIGIVPAMRLSRKDAAELLRAGAGSSQTGRMRRRYSLLVILEVAGALVLVAVASLLIETARRINEVNVGYDTSNLVYALVRLRPLGRTTEPARAVQHAAAIQSRLSEMPEVVSVAREFQGAPEGHAVTVDNAALPQREIPITGMVRFVTADFLRTLRLPVVRGRDFAGEDENGDPVAIIDETTAERFWPGQDAIGRMLKLGSERSSRPWARVVGVTRAPMFLAAPCLAGDCPPAIFVLDGTTRSYGSDAPLIAEFAIRVHSRPAQFLLTLHHGGLQDGPGMFFIVDLWSRTTGLDTLRESHAFIAALFTAFSLFGLALAMIGVYGVVSRTVTQRTKEFGIRAALGADRPEILRMVFREGNALVLAGLALGLLLAIWAARLIAFFLYGAERVAPLFLAAAMLTTYGAVLLASVIPAVRATRANPVDALRAE